MPRNSQSILGANVDVLTWEEAIEQIVRWGEKHESRYICVCNVHSVVTASRDQNFKMAISDADMATPDGAPIAWALRQMGFPSQKRINGPDLMWKYFGEAERLGQSVFFYGSAEETLEKLCSSIARAFPDLIVAGTHSPPYRSLSKQEDALDVEMINRSGAHIVFVGLGCPTQEKWMAAHRGRINAVMIGVGAAFDYHSGVIKRAPLWMQRRGLEWLYRLLTEPRRLYKRYLICNTLFTMGIAKQLIVRMLARN